MVLDLDKLEETVKQGPSQSKDIGHREQELLDWWRPILINDDGSPKTIDECSAYRISELPDWKPKVRTKSKKGAWEHPSDCGFWEVLRELGGDHKKYTTKASVIPELQKFYGVCSDATPDVPNARVQKQREQEPVVEEESEESNDRLERERALYKLSMLAKQPIPDEVIKQMTHQELEENIRIFAQAANEEVVNNGASDVLVALNEGLAHTVEQISPMLKSSVGVSFKGCYQQTVNNREAIRGALDECLLNDPDVMQFFTPKTKLMLALASPYAFAILQSTVTKNSED